MKDEKIVEARKMLCSYIGQIARAKGLTTYKLAEMTGFKQPNIQRMLSGKYSPTLDNFMILCEAIDTYVFIIDKTSDNDLAQLMKDRWRYPGQES